MPSPRETPLDTVPATPFDKTTPDTDVHAEIPAADIPGQATEEPLRQSQREAQDDESPGS